MNTVKIFIVSNEYGQFSEYPNWINNHEVVEDIKEADLVMFTGGEDVSPYFYGEKQHPKTMSNPWRDQKEEKAFIHAQKLNKPILGICRGSQFVCVMAGGRLVQDQEPQPYIHKMNVETDKGTEQILISSTHHQAQFPYNMGEDRYKVLGWTEGLSSYHHNSDFGEMRPEKECEIVYYPHINALGIQGHPEKLVNDITFIDNFRETKGNEKVKVEFHRTLEVCNELVTKLLNNKL